MRQDLIAALQKLASRRKAGKPRFDGIIIETTGLVYPAPIAQTLFVDKSVEALARLDGIAKRIDQYLDEEEAQKDYE